MLQLRGAGNFDQAQTAGAHVAHAFQMAQRRDFHAGIGGDLQYGRAFLGADLLAVNN